jgi:hypothetical protein
MESNVCIDGYERFDSWWMRYVYGLWEVLRAMLKMARPVGLRIIAAASLCDVDGEADAVVTVGTPGYDSWITINFSRI